jgi:uncharacterized protein YxjI
MESTLEGSFNPTKPTQEKRPALSISPEPLPSPEPSRERPRDVPTLSSLLAQQSPVESGPSSETSQLIHSIHPAFLHNQYEFRRKALKIFGGSFDVKDESGNLAMYSHQKEFKLREDFNIYSDKTRQHALLHFKTPDILDFHATYHVEDPESHEEIGSIKRQWLQSMVRDEWTIMDPEGKTVGKLTERSGARALFARLLGPILPQKYSIYTADDTEVARIDRHFNPFVLKYTMNVTHPNPPIDRRLLVTSGILLAAIERREKGWNTSSSNSSSSSGSSSHSH